VSKKADIFTWRGLLWTPCKLRKASVCEYTNTKLKPGDSAYRPITNSQHRMHRLGQRPPSARTFGEPSTTGEEGRV
jgi:hypothetical protein